MNKRNSSIVFLIEIGRELLNPLNYLTAVFIGSVINLLQGMSPVASPFPFIVPIIVQVFSKGILKFRRRNEDLLLNLPRQREDPAFIIDQTGMIIVSDDQTREFLNNESCKCIRGFLDLTPEQFKMMTGEHPSMELLEDIYSPIRDRFYNISFKSADRFSGYRIIWMTDVTQLHQTRRKLEAVYRFTEELLKDKQDLVYQNDIFQRLISLVLQMDYEAVFMVNARSDQQFSGRIYKYSEGSNGRIPELVVSPVFPVLSKDAPVFVSRGVNKVVSAHREDYADEFDRKYPFISEVSDFIGHGIFNFVNYHQGDLSIIAFNRKTRITPLDETAFETVVNSARTVYSLLELADAAESRILQSIEGLCAAAEFSDEITGKHILRVNRYSRKLSEILGEEQKFCTWIGQVAAIHDIGKVAIPHIIKLERKLSPQEILEMQMHTVYGAQILHKMMNTGRETDQRLVMGARIALNHHQLWNGTGYPGLMRPNGGHTILSGKSHDFYASLDPLKGKQIPREALIVSIADKYDALRGKRQYKPEFNHKKTLDILANDDRSGISGPESFSQEIFSAFMDHQREFAEIFEKFRN